MPKQRAAHQQRALERPQLQPDRPGDLLKAPGEALPPEAQSAFAPLFSHDLSRIRIHADDRAAREAAEGVEARAFAFGPHIVFGEGEYDPFNPRGQGTLLHELAHTAQQPQHVSVVPHDLGFASDAHESEARGFARGESNALSSAPLSIARLREGEEGGNGEQLNRAALLEVAAHGLAYERFDERGNWIPQETDPVKARQERERRAYYMEVMRRGGYDVDSSRSVEGQGDFGMRSFLPNARDPRARELSPIVAFRGTDSLVDDGLGADTNPEGVGANQFARNRDLIRAQMALAARSGNGQLTLSGHSLGGALAQQAAADQPNLVQDVTTFQSPGVMRGVADRFDEGNAARVAAGLAPMSSTHYRASGMDVVPWAGSAMTAGTVQTFDPVGGGSPMDHTAYPLLSRALRRGEGMDGLSGDAQQGMIGVLTGERDFSSNVALTRDSDAANQEGFGFSEAARRAAGSFVWDPLRAAATTVGGMATPFGFGAVGINQALPDGNLTSMAMEGATDRVARGWNWGTAQANSGADRLEAFGNGRWDTWQGRATRGMDAVQETGSEVWGGINDFGTRRADRLEARARQFNDFAGDYIPDQVSEGVRDTWNSARGFVSSASDAIGDTANSVVRGVRNTVGGVADGVRNEVRGAWNDGRALVSRAATRVEDFGSGVRGQVNDAARYIRENPIAIEGYRRARAGVQSGVNTARNVYNDVSDRVTSAASSTVQTVGDTASRAWSATTDTASRAWNATGDAASRATDTVTNTASRVWNWLTDD
jgi:hypothetical protein